MNDGYIAHQTREQFAGAAAREKPEIERLQVREKVSAKIGDDALGDPGCQITVAHRTETLKEDQTKKRYDQFRHSLSVVVHGDDVPEDAGHAEQGKVDRCHTHDQ